MNDAVWTELKKLDNWEPMWDALRAFEKLTGGEVEALPTTCVTVGHETIPCVLQTGERVVFHFEGVEQDMSFQAGDKVIEIFTRSLKDVPFCRFKLGHVYHDWGNAFYPLRAEVRGRNVSLIYDVESDSAFYRYLQSVDMRAAQIFSIMWRLQMGPVIMNRDGQIAGALYS